ncbi:MAG TPA: prolipoprotein diacylglyceryl transferase [Polyangiaceae bacterium]|nr:prolipoprotein diacylglyceryl transferase [Polyangiaceae bacterium]
MPAFTWDIDPILLHFPSGLSWLPIDGIRYYSLLYVGVFLGGYKLLDWQIRRAGGAPEDANDFVLYGIVAVLGGARAGHVFFYEWERFADNPLGLFKIHEGGLSSHGATLGLLLAMFLFTQFRRQSFIEGCDRFAFSAALGAILVRIGNFFNSEIVGRVTGGDWGVRFPRYDRVPVPPLRHPSQLYEVLLGAGVMLALVCADRALGKEKRPRGAMISLFMALYFTGRFIVEFFKEYQPGETAVGLTTGQWLSLLPAALGYAGLWLSLQRRVPARWNVYRAPQSDLGGVDDDDDDGGDADVDEVLLERGASRRSVHR